MYLLCDGPSCHFSMLKYLGASIKWPNNINGSFPNPSNISQMIRVFLDVCHMLKLVRNTLGEKKTLSDDQKRYICWQYIVDLQELQDKEGLRLGNKLKAAHINWSCQKMKVNLAAQALSASVADAIEYCNVVLKLPQFHGSEGTVHFIRVFDRLFDILNSRSFVAKGFKAPMKLANKHQWEPFLNYASKYISNLMDYNRNATHEERQDLLGSWYALRVSNIYFLTS